MVNNYIYMYWICYISIIMIIIKHIIHIAYPKVVYVFGILYPIITGYDIYICMYKIYGYIWLITMVIIYACMIMYVDIYTYLYG
jgi:hypothetical protein